MLSHSAKNNLDDSYKATDAQSRFWPRQQKVSWDSNYVSAVVFDGGKMKGRKRDKKNEEAQMLFTVSQTWLYRLLLFAQRQLQ